MENLEFIENYFNGINDDAQTQLFEKKIMEDASFAEEVAFYISANETIKQQLQEEKKQRFREIYDQQKVISINQPVRNMWKYMAAAGVIVAVVLITWFVSGNKNSPQQLADKYIQQNFQTLSVTMGNPDSVQAGLNLFNSKKLTEALSMFESIAKNNPANSDAKRYAGIVSLRMNNYDKALEYFTMLATDTSLYSNPGKFYEAVTLLKRNKDGDKEAAKLLLQEVRDQNLEGKNEAEEWLGKMD
jgi:tetratricopeptide (TPR) repeat protein